MDLSVNVKCSSQSEQSSGAESLTSTPGDPEGETTRCCISTASCLPRKPGMEGDVEALALCEGQSAGLVTHVQSAGEVVKALADETTQVLEHCASLSMDAGSARDHDRVRSVQWAIGGGTAAESGSQAVGINAVIWATGYQLDFGWVHVPVFDEVGHPVHQRGITSASGLYVLGLHWLYKLKSAPFFGVGEDAAFLAAAIAAKAEHNRLTALQVLRVCVKHVVGWFALRSFQEGSDDEV